MYLIIFWTKSNLYFVYSLQVLYFTVDLGKFQVSQPQKYLKVKYSILDYILKASGDYTLKWNFTFQHNTPLTQNPNKNKSSYW